MNDANWFKVGLLAGLGLIAAVVVVAIGLWAFGVIGDAANKLSAEAEIKRAQAEGLKAQAKAEEEARIRQIENAQIQAKAQVQATVQAQAIAQARTQAELEQRQALAEQIQKQAAVQAELDRQQAELAKQAEIDRQTALAAQQERDRLSMVSWWPGDGNANDIMDGNHGALTGGVTFAAGMVGQAFSLNGIDASVDAGNAPNLQVSAGDFTVDVWVRFNALRGDMSIVDKMSPRGVNTDGWRLLKQADNRIWFCLGAGGNGCAHGAPTTVRSSTEAKVGVWFHISAVKTSSAISIYINGVLEDTKPLAPFTDTHNANLLIGSYVLEGSHLNGLVDEVEFFNRALSGTEIKAIYDADSAGTAKP